MLVAIGRGLLFTAGGALALPSAATFGYFIPNLPVFIYLACLAPAAILCWVLAVCHKGGDLWTAGYVVAYLLGNCVLVPVAVATQ